jgi:diacylglycerol O-acyltransferase / wax synthase
VIGLDAQTSLKGELGSTRRVAWSSAVPLEQVKTAGRSFGATVNDVVLAAVAGALRSYLKGHDGLVEELRAIVPYNLRPIDEPLPRELGNRFGLVFASLPVGIGSRHERLVEVKRRMDAVKRSREAPVSYGLLSAVGLTPTWIERMVIGQFAAKATAVVTNVPGPSDRVSFAGAPVRGVVVWAPCSGNVGISVSIFSYAGELTLGLAVDARLVPEPQEIVDACDAELGALVADASQPDHVHTNQPSSNGRLTRRVHPREAVGTGSARRVGPPAARR